LTREPLQCLARVLTGLDSYFASREVPRTHPLVIVIDLTDRGIDRLRIHTALPKFLAQHGPS